MVEKIAIVGDLHRNLRDLNEFIKNQQPEMILQCGDFAWFPNHEHEDHFYHQEQGWTTSTIQSQNTSIYWCDGNHEDHSVIIQDGQIHEVATNVYHCSRGSTLALPDGRIVLFAGGADSIDKNFRTPGHDWFPEENITTSQLDLMMSHGKIDIVISHTAPLSFNASGFTKECGMVSNRFALEQVLEKYRPDLWYFGHWHNDTSGVHKNTKWQCLDYPGNSGKWWTWIE